MLLSVKKYYHTLAYSLTGSSILGLQPWEFFKTFGFTKESKGLVLEDSKRKTCKDRCQGDKAFELCNLSDGRGGSAKGFILWYPLPDQAVDVDGDTIRSRIMPKMAEKLSFLMRRTVEVCKKSRLHSIFKAKSLDFGGISIRICKKDFGLL